MALKNTDFIAEHELAGTGWTGTMIRRLLGSPDQILYDPYYPDEMSIKLYQVGRVRQVEQMEEYRKLRHHSIKGANIKEKAGHRKVVEMLAQVAAGNVDDVADGIEGLGEAYTTVRKKSILSFNRKYWKTGNRITPATNERFIERVAVNYIRHERCAYEKAVDHFQTKDIGPEVHDRLKVAVLDAIAKNWPELEQECFQQKIAMKQVG